MNRRGRKWKQVRAGVTFGKGPEDDWAGEALQPVLQLRESGTGSTIAHQRRHVSELRYRADEVNVRCIELPEYSAVFQRKGSRGSRLPQPRAVKYRDNSALICEVRILTGTFRAPDPSFSIGFLNVFAARSRQMLQEEKPKLTEAHRLDEDFDLINELDVTLTVLGHRPKRHQMPILPPRTAANTKTCLEPISIAASFTTSESREWENSHQQTSNYCQKSSEMQRNSRNPTRR